MKLVAFLRAINVGGHTVKMDVLKKHFEAMGFKNVETFIASGNVIFDGTRQPVEVLEKKIEAVLLKTLGYEVVTFIRTVAEVAAVAKYAAFPDALLKKAGAYNVAFLKAPLDAAGKKLLTTFKTDIDDFHTHGCELYWLCKTRQSDSKFSNVRFEKGLKVSATFRGINTIHRLMAKYPV